MRSVSEQPSAAGVTDQLHGKISEKLASAVWIRPVGCLPGHFTKVEAITNRAFVNGSDTSDADRSTVNSTTVSITTLIVHCTIGLDLVRGLRMMRPCCGAA
jgi:hypothetical protein